MASPRRFNVELQLTPYFHCTSRCVRGSYLCGIDRTTGVDNTHRRKWLTERLLFLAECFAIKLAAYTVMENHFHVVIRVEKPAALSWSDKEVVSRWHKLFKGTDVSQRFSNSEVLTEYEQIQLSNQIKKWRLSLHDISWFMRCAKEPLARIANKEDNCKGRFWEGRFHSQALLDNKAVVACMTYVDLNPVRAKAQTLPESDPYSSFKLRTIELLNSDGTPDKTTKAMVDLTHYPTHCDLPPPIELGDYINLVDNTARQSRHGKRGQLHASVTPILNRIGISSRKWSELVTTFKSNFHALVGDPKSVQHACEHLGLRSAWGQSKCHFYFDT